MSIQDESFPHDELFSDAEFSFSNNAHQRYQFPNVRRHSQQQQQHIQQLKENLKFIELKAKVEAEDAGENATADANKAMNNSSVSGTSSNEENLSTEASNGRPSSVLSGKTTVSEPTNFGGEKTHMNANADDGHNVLGKASSYQNMHSEYTKRRYRHVQSKVGQYIAQMKAEEEKRRNSVKFQRHRSLPETLIQDQHQQLQQQSNGKSSNNNNMKHHHHHHHREKRYSSLDLQMPKMDESISDADTNLSEMLTGTATNTASSGSSSNSSSSMQRHECSTDDAAQITNIDFIDKLTYAQLVNEKERIQSYSDYLQARLDEKMGENMRLKRNVDYLRIELSNCQDKLKRQCTQQHNQSMSVSSMSMRASGSNSLSGSSSAMHALGRQMHGGTLNNTMRSTKATQTELQMPTLPTATATPMKLSVLLAHDMFSTPDITPTSDTNNNHADESGATDCDATGNTSSNMTTAAAVLAKGNKSIATFQLISLNMSNIVGGECSSLDSSQQHNVLRQRLNSGYQQQLQQSHLLSASNAQDSARSSCPSSSDSAIDIESAEMAPSPKRQRSRVNMDGAEEVDASEFVYYSGITGHVALETHNANSPAIMLSNLNFNERSDSSYSVEMPSSSYACRNVPSGNRKQKSLRRRWLRFFSPCSRCKDLNQTMEQSQTQIPLLEKSAE